MVRVQYDEGETIFRKHDDDHDVFLVIEGIVDIVDFHLGRDDLVAPVVHGHYFGDWEAIFQEPRLFTARSRTRSDCFRIDGDDFLTLLHESPGFAQAFGTTLRDNQGIFAAFDRFRIALQQSVNQGHISIGDLLPLYERLKPALHPGADDPGRLDLGALLYAVRRLPENVTRTFAFLLLDELPPAYPQPDRYFPVVATAGRRRDVWEMLPGKDMVLLRSGDSDLIDLITTLCVYAVEARKIRERLLRYADLGVLDAFVPSRDGSGTEAEFLQSLPFSSREAQGFLSIWPSDAIARIGDIARHREMFTIDVRRRLRSYHSRRSELWISQIADAAKRTLGIDPADLAPSVSVHIVSSNTHSITNCLNPWFTEHAEEILAWGAREHPQLIAEQWAQRTDLIYALSRAYFAAFPAQNEARRSRGESCGVTLLEQTSSTGIQVQLIDPGRVASAAIDPLLPAIPEKRTTTDLIVNIDYAFGEQAEYIMRNLLLLFGSNVRSISFLGKAGALVGNRGDVLAPTAFIEQSNDLFQPLPHESLLSVDRLRRLLPERTIHEGPLLTVDGTLLQNRQMLNFYRHIWDVVGMEMEGTHYYRQILESQELGVVPRNLDLRFFYYVSDLPLQVNAQLSEPLRLAEGIPPLYAVTRHILTEIINRGSS